MEETPKSLSDLLKVSTVVKHRTLEDQSSLLLQDMVRARSSAKALQLTIVQNFVQEQRERILIAERSLLHTLAFDFNIEHPYKFLLSTVKQMQAYSYIAEDNTRDLAQIAWNFANDRYADLLGHRLFLSDNQFEDNSLSSSLRESLCKRCHLSRYDDRESLTSALTMLTATKFMGTKLNLPKDWCSALGMDERECEKISNEILDVYERSDRVVSAQISKSAFQ